MLAFNTISHIILLDFMTQMNLERTVLQLQFFPGGLTSTRKYDACTERICTGCWLFFFLLLFNWVWFSESSWTSTCGFLGKYFHTWVSHCRLSGAEKKWLAQDHPIDFVSKAGQELTISRFLAWCLSHYTLLALPVAYQAQLKVLLLIFNVLI